MLGAGVLCVGDCGHPACAQGLVEQDKEVAGIACPHATVWAGWGWGVEVVRRVDGCEMHCHKYKTIDSARQQGARGQGVKLLWLCRQLNRRGLIQNDCHYGGVAHPRG